MSQSPNHRHAELRIVGMTCASCELVLERKLKAIPGIVDVKISHRTGIARITAKADALPSEERLASVIRKAGYSLAGEEAPTITSVAPGQRKWMEIGASLVIIF